jgi:hypothetical protein
MRNATFVTGGKPIVVWSQSISGAIAVPLVVHPSVAFYDIHGRKGGVLVYSSVPDTTRDVLLLNYGKMLTYIPLTLYPLRASKGISDIRVHNPSKMLCLREVRVWQIISSSWAGICSAIAKFVCIVFLKLFGKNRIKFKIVLSRNKIYE